jgi:hypothetical protein
MPYALCCTCSRSFSSVAYIVGLLCSTDCRLKLSLLHTSAYVSIRQHTLHNHPTMHAYVSTDCRLKLSLLHTSAYVSIRQHTNTYIYSREVVTCDLVERLSACVSIR